MINRVLIRIKVIQLLYSYLLIENNFALASQPSNPTKEKRFAYKLYIDTLILFIKIARGIEKRGGDKPLMNNRFIRIISTDDKICSELSRISVSGFPYEAALPSIIKEVKESGIYKKYLKLENPSLSDDVRLWQELFDLIVVRNEEYNAIASRQENFTFRGVDKMKEIMAETFVSFFSSTGAISDAKKQLAASMLKARELYLRLLLLPVEITRLRDLQIDDARHKHLPTDEDLNPNMRFVENELVAILSKNQQLIDFAESNKISWYQESPEFLQRMLKLVMDSEVYKEYMSKSVTDLDSDCELWRNLLKQIILPSEDFLEALEDKSIFWNDDLEIISTFVLKTLRKISEGEETDDFIMPMFKDKEDELFGEELFEAVISGKERYKAMIDECIRKDSWDTDRLAFMDVVIIITAIAELLSFPKIPVKVTVNEYIEMAKAYSTSKSGVFVNGILGGIITRLRQTGELQKGE